MNLRTLFLWIPPLALMALIWCYAAPNPGEQPPLPFPHFDKLQHFGAYAVLCSLFAFAIRGTWPQPSWRVVLASSAALASLYGAIDEIHQYFIPGRICDLVDWLFDLFGALSAATLLHGLSRRSPNLQTSNP